ncbi:MAG: hypothetical protein GX181_10145 [Synergistaceae bacterium]|nr:hypothetical protein [Synergistota bacterium]NLM72299.1 hypothetical protein [Synergistaceae bacterium]
MKTASAIVLALSLILSSCDLGHARLKVLSAPQYPVSLTLDQRYGVIRSAFARTPAGLHRLDGIENLRLLSSTARPVKTEEGDDALLWRIDFEKPKSEERLSLWITAISDGCTAWFAIAPSGPTYWDRLCTPSDAKDGVFLYISPRLPAYCGLEEQDGPETLSFVYAMTITCSGPNLVAAPAVYGALLPLAHLFREAQSDEGMRAAYGELCRDFERMSNGGMPSREAMEAFPWRRILTVEWGR